MSAAQKSVPQRMELDMNETEQAVMNALLGAFLRRQENSPDTGKLYLDETMLVAEVMQKTNLSREAVSAVITTAISQNGLYRYGTMLSFDEPSEEDTAGHA
jgi:hypothetical protein